ncbi:DNA polymerase III subunit theta, partial [Acinetobacter baumannii]|uniref:DNA polymerase III subunit theta n=1 Tax=Acinetobacter baumannii TaxID=470 RepID=UPI003FCD0BFB
MHMSKWNIASFSKEDQDKVSVDKVAAAVAWQEKMFRLFPFSQLRHHGPVHPFLPG